MSLSLAIYIFSWIVPVSLLIGAFLNLPKISSLDSVYKVICIYLLSALLFDIAGRITGHVIGNNLFLIPIFGLVELIIISILYGLYLIPEQRSLVFAIAGAGSIYIVYECITTDFTNTVEFQSYARPLEAFLIVIFSIIFYIKSLTKEENLNQNLLGLNALILIFFSLNLVLLLPINYLVNTDLQIRFYFWFANQIITLIFYIILIQSIWKNGKIRKPLHFGSE